MTARDLFTRCTHDWLRPIATSAIALLLVAATASLVNLSSDVRVISQKVEGIDKKMDQRQSNVDRRIQRHDDLIEGVRQRVRRAERCCYQGDSRVNHE